MSWRVAVLVAEDEVVRGGQLEFFELDPGRGKPDPDQLIGIRIGQGFEENAFEDAENNRVGTYAGGQRNEGNGREHRGPPEPAENLLELALKGFHRAAPILIVPVR
jgi:hypothetical protein